MSNKRKWKNLIDKLSLKQNTKYQNFDTVNRGMFISRKIAIGVLLLCVVLIVACVMAFANNRWKITRNVAINNFEDVHALELSDSGESSLFLASEESDVNISTTNTTKWDLTKVDIVYDTEGIAVPVPKGYVASGADGEHTVNTGFVIYEGDGEITTENAWNESCSRNQFVWVPVPDVSRIYKTLNTGKKKAILYDYSSTGRTVSVNNVREPDVVTSRYDIEQYFAEYGLQGITREKLLEDLQVEFEATIESIRRYGGFYIGRYETGNLNRKEPVIQRMNTNISSCAWYKIYNTTQMIGAGENVKTSMIFGCLWDETLQWLVDSGNKTYAEIADSISWGNHGGATFEYKSVSGEILTKTSNSKIPTGSTEYMNANNIYDMAGNVWENTLEHISLYGATGRAYRGGGYYFSSGYSISSRTPGSPNGSGEIYGARVYMYIK